MKIINILKITLCFVLVVSSIAGNLKKKAVDSGDGTPPIPKILDQMQLMIVREELKRCLKMGTPTTKDSPFDMCMKIMTAQKHMDKLTAFWGFLVKIFMWNSPQPSVTKTQIMAQFTSIGADEKMTNGKTCQDIMNDMLTDDETMASRARDMRDTISPELPSRPAVPVSKLNYVTAFNGVHRYTTESTTLIPKLNDIANRPGAAK